MRTITDLLVYLFILIHEASCQTCELNSACDGKTSSLSKSKEKPPCQNANDLGPRTVDEEHHSFRNIEDAHPELWPGGHWRPRDCRANQSVAILVPYRDREDDLKLFTNNIHKFLQTQQLDYTIYLIEQYDDKNFNRGMLLNIGFELASQERPYDCIVLHDVDKYPEDTRNNYSCTGKVKHLFTKPRYHNQDYRKMPYNEYFGGVTSLSSKNFRIINGFSNEFWGWGSEDDDLLNRIKHHNVPTESTPRDLGIYVETWHPYGFVNPKRHEVNADGKNRWDWDGLGNLKFKLVKKIKQKLFTRLKVELLSNDPYYKIKHPDP